MRRMSLEPIECFALKNISYEPNLYPTIIYRWEDAIDTFFPGYKFSESIFRLKISFRVYSIHEKETFVEGNSI